MEDYHQFFNSLSALPSPTIPVSELVKLAPMTIEEHSSTVPHGLCDKRAGVYLLCGHLKCDWQHTLMNAQNRSNFK
eukprot:11184653-Prorocentrum_lima.AAC.1